MPNRNGRVDDYDIEGSAEAKFLLNGCGLFALSNGDAVESVVLDLELAFTQTDFQYVDAFPLGGGARVCAFKCRGQEDRPLGLIANIWMTDF